MNVVELFCFLVCFILPALLFGIFVSHRTEPWIGLFVGFGTFALLFTPSSLLLGHAGTANAETNTLRVISGTRAYDTEQARCRQGRVRSSVACWTRLAHPA